jgi:hypothetical protein
MARSSILVSLLIFVAVVSCRSTYRLALRVEQSLVGRATSLSGWPLAAVPCPAVAPVVCSTGIESQINQQCCPSGTTCVGWPTNTYPVCCLNCKWLLASFQRSIEFTVTNAEKIWYFLAQDCNGQLENVPVCANSSWNMFELGQNNYFCCEQGQVGVIPQAGYAGICQAGGQGVPSSLLATMVGCLYLQALTRQVADENYSQ